MAENYENAQAIATAKHMHTTVLYVRCIGDNEQGNIKSLSSPYGENSCEQFPGARFIKGKFLQATFPDDIILETLSDPA